MRDFSLTLHENFQSKIWGDWTVSSEKILRLAISFYIILFFAYLFGPLIVMSITAFNSAEFPRLSPWDCFSTEWFGVLVNDARIMGGFKNSLIIGIAVVFVSVPIGLAGALMLGQLSNRVRPVFYTLTIFKILNASAYFKPHWFPLNLAKVFTLSSMSKPCSLNLVI